MNHNYNISPEELEKIERFITGGMSSAEAKEFEELLNNNAQLREKTDEIRLLLIGISEHALSEKLDDFHKEVPPVEMPRGRVVPLGRKLLIAASVLAIAFVTIWWFVGRKTDDEALYARLYSPDPGLATVMGNSSEYDFDKAMVEYKNGEYDKALKAWTGSLGNHPTNDTLNYFVGAAYQAKNDDRCIEYLEKVAADTSSVFNKDASWYLGLYYLKSGQKEKAYPYIQQSGHPKSSEALKAINKK
ncbi:MAG: hypothetical protein JNK79_00285 [Chitinophagaceae bacterium]|nr:hypothetical protein [Chitinophagaceae bacterium]